MELKIHSTESGNNPLSIKLKDIQDRKIDGVIVKNFLNSSELESVKANIKASDCSISTIAPYGKIIGKKLESDSGNFQELPLTDYLENSSHYRSLMASDVGVDFENRFKDVCANVFGEQVEVPMLGGLSYIPAAVRCLFPEGGGIMAHVGNEFIMKMPEIKALHEISNPYNQLSFFFVVQMPDEGGELVLYDATWDETKPLNLSFQETVAKVKTRDKEVVHLKEGDLIIFGGGRS